MPEFKDTEWRYVEKSKTIPLTPRHYVDIQVSCVEPVQVLGLREGKATVLKAGKEFRFKAQVKGFEALEVVGTVPFGLREVTKPMQLGENNSGERPPVTSMPEPSNLLLKMRQLARAHHEFSRMPVLEPDDFPSFGRYEMDDEDDVLFEEEAYERHQKAKAEKAAKAKAEKEAKEKQPATPPQEPAEPASGSPGAPSEPAGNLAAE